MSESVDLEAIERWSKDLESRRQSSLPVADPQKELVKKTQEEFKYKSQIGATPTRVASPVGVTADQWLDGNFWASVISSNVEAIRFDDKMRELYVRFKGGVTYCYSQVPRQTGEAMFLCASMGKFVHQRLKNKFTYRKL